MEDMDNISSFAESFALKEIENFFKTKFIRKTATKKKMRGGMMRMMTNVYLVCFVRKIFKKF